MSACATVSFVKYCRQELEGTPFSDVVKTSLKALEVINESIKQYDSHIRKTAAEHYPQTALLEQIPGVGPITSLSFVLTVGDPQRFEDPRDVGPYFGLVPRRDQSGDTDKQLPISKAGNSNLRRLLVQCAQYILGRYGPDCDLRDYGLRLAARGGKAAKKKAVIATARKLAVLMLVLWKAGQSYEPMRNCTAKESAAA